MKDVVSITEGLFALSKVCTTWFDKCIRLNTPLQETAKLEAESFVLKQKVTLASELKSVLDSWVRYEQQAKESEQAALAKTVIENVLKTIQDERSQKDILASAVAEVERECHLIGTLPDLPLTVTWVSAYRTRQVQGYLEEKLDGRL